MNWQGRAHIGLGWAAFVGTAGDNHAHAHHALQFVVGFDAPVRLWTATEGDCTRRSVLLDRDVRHALSPSENRLGLLYLDAETEAARGLRAGLARGLAPWVDVDLQRPFVAAADGDHHALGDLLRVLGVGAAAVPTADGVIHALLDRLTTAPELPGTLTTLAAWTPLSPSRLAHRFSAYTGMPVRPYLRWLRLQRSARAIGGGASVTDAAHAAGFADAAHLTRTFRRHFGIAPSVLSSLARRPN